MNDKELREKLDSIRENLNLFGIRPHLDMPNKQKEGYDPDDKETWTYTLTNDQAEAVKELDDLFQRLNWQLALNEYKEINYSKKTIVSEGLRPQGSPVKITPCAEEYNGKTYFGILLGDIAMHISCSIDGEGILNIAPSMHNPAIYVPELKKIIYGCESWWGIIENEEDLEKVITKETIKNVWYMKLLKKMSGGENE